MIVKSPDSALLLKLILAKLDNVSVKEASRYMDKIFGSDEIRYEGVEICLDELICTNKLEFAKQAANTVKIRFFGGPPGDCGWFNGTVYTYLCDKVMWCVAQKKTEVLEKFLKCLK